MDGRDNKRGHSLTVDDLLDLLDLVVVTRGIEQDTTVLILGEVRDLPGGVGNVVGAALLVVLNKLRQSLETMEGTINGLSLEDSLTIDGNSQGVALVCVQIKVVIRGLDIDDNCAQG